MATPLGSVSVRTGTTSTQAFSQSGLTGDWRTFNIPFNPGFRPFAAGKIRVFATATRQGLAANDRGAPVVPVVGQISPQGFAIWARNSDIVRGNAAFNWIAVAEVPDAPPTNASALFGSLSPLYFSTAAKPGDWNSYSTPVPESRKPANPVPVVATAANMNVRVHASAAVPVVGAAAVDQVSLSARNSDVGAGLASFNYLAFLPGVAPSAKLIVDTGRVFPLFFAKGGQRGDWQTWTVNFADHFISPPGVIVTADNYDGNLRSYAVAATAMANDVTANGFTLTARNSDVSAGWVAFSWLAVGYVP
jgi:hypothetical protein